MNSTASTEENETSELTLRVVTGDLFLGTRLAGYGRAAGYRVLPGPRLTEQDWERLETSAARMIIALASASAWNDGFAKLSDDAKARVAAYAPHVRTDLLKAARTAGINAVFTQGQLETKIPSWLVEHAS